ncbi:putative nuclease HARBI1 [Nasonia vitripennis]|uniref:DDE Tnp4 domain-containing protein n=1 Tax=Nasonia vitripennis TaxID=7425 RepID=A0A7M7HAU0_NASVI|nr:putative nuclease HARBI1 [Nasonia vitripennis]
MLIRDLEPDLIGVRASAIPPYIQILSVLRFLAEGSYQKGFCQDFHHPISQATASRWIIRVVDAINNNLANRFLIFPTTELERDRIQARFRRSIRIPGIIGLIDCFIIGMTRPTANEEAFYHYRHAHGLIVQIIVDANYNILNIRTCPGSNNDRYVWQFSEAREYMENLRAEGEGERNCYLLGDSGYTVSPVLLTPILDAQPGTPEAAYTTEHVRTRCRVEQTIGIFTNVWRVLKRARKLHYTPNKLARITNACAILHNYRRRHGIHDNIPPIRQRNVRLLQRPRDHPAGIAERQRIIQAYYR